MELVGVFSFFFLFESLKKKMNEGIELFFAFLLACVKKVR